MPGDFYQILGVPRDASQRDITSAYRRLARRYHPDVTGGDAEAEARFKEVNAAHDVLSDDNRRAAYNRWGDQWEHADQLEEFERQRGGFGGFSGFGGGPHTSGRTGGVQFDFSNAAFGDEGLGDLLGNLFGGRGGAGAQPAPARGRDVEHQLTVSLREAFAGATRTLQRVAGSSSALEVIIPPGVDNGSRIKISGQGEQPPGFSPPGDLYLMIAVGEDPVFARDGDDLHVQVDVPVATAALGGEAVVRTLGGGGLALRIPPGTQSGRHFRLAGQGMPRFKRAGRGDMIAEVSLKLPEPLTAQQRALFQQLCDLEPGDGGNQP